MDFGICGYPGTNPLQILRDDCTYLIVFYLFWSSDYEMLHILFFIFYSYRNHSQNIFEVELLVLFIVLCLKWILKDCPGSLTLYIWKKVQIYKLIFGHPSWSWGLKCRLLLNFLLMISLFSLWMLLSCNDIRGQVNVDQV